LNILKNNVSYSVFKKQEDLFNSSTRLKKFRNSVAYKPSSRHSTATAGYTNSLPVYSEEAITPTALLPLNKFYYYPIESSADLIDESSEAPKSAKFLQFNDYKNSIRSSSNSVSPYSYTYVLDPFRADYEDCTWSYDTGTFDSDLNDHESHIKNLRPSNLLSLRSTAKNSGVTYNAIQKVFKSRLDEGRSHSRLQDFSNSFVAQPFISAPRSLYGSMIGKNKESFFSPQFYNQSSNNNFNVLFSV